MIIRRGFINWVCALALLLQGLGPVGQVLASAPSGHDDGAFPGVQVICTAYGLQQMPVDGESPIKADSSDFCPLCQLQATTAVLPTSGPALPLTLSTLTRLHPKTGHFILASIGVTPTPPRGPPALLS